MSDQLLLEDTSSAGYVPLAERLRPANLQQVIGQQHLLAEGRPLARLLEAGKLHSIVFWGPPGCGKTTLARLVTKQSNAELITISAVLSGVKEIRQAVEQAQQVRQQQQRITVLFVDEVHRFNKSQQDAFLPHIENGTIIFIGATTENPSFELNNALLSRLRVYLLQPLQVEDLQTLLQRAVALCDPPLQMDMAQQQLLVGYADGDARRLLNVVEMVADVAVDGVVTDSMVSDLLRDSLRRFDKGGEQFYDQISALHKSIRGSNPDAALYWMARMVDGGCDPLYIARRLIRTASEDIGNADPRALTMALECWDVLERLGYPEGNLVLAQTVIYLAVAAKSNAVYSAWKAVQQDIPTYGSAAVPMHLRNAPTRMMKQLGYSEGYRYAHDEQFAYAAGVDYFAEGMPAKRYYYPVDRGLEQRIAERLAFFRSLDLKATSGHN